METLAEDLLLLAIKPKNGMFASPERINFGLAGAELVRLAAYGRIDIVADRIVVRDPTPTGDPLLDPALDVFIRTSVPIPVKIFVSRPRLRIQQDYIQRLVDRGVIRGEMSKFLVIFSIMRWRVADQARLAEVRARLDAIAHSSGPVDTEQAAFGGLAVATGLDEYLYGGFSGRKARKRLAEIASGQASAAAASAVADDAQVRARRSSRPEPVTYPDLTPMPELDRYRLGLPGHPQHAQPHPAQSHPAQSHPAQPYPAQPYPAQPYPAQPYPAQAHPAQAHPGQNGPVHAAGLAATDTAAYTASDAAAQAATNAATQAATNAATHAATQAATHAAVHAATHAAVSAAHSAANHASSSHGGGFSGGHGGFGGHSGGGGGDHGGGGGHHH